MLRRLLNFFSNPTVVILAVKKKDRKNSMSWMLFTAKKKKLQNLGAKVKTLGYACGNSNTDPMNTNGSKEWDRGRAKED